MFVQVGCLGRSAELRVLALNVAVGVLSMIVPPYFVMAMGTGGAARLAHERDNLPSFDQLSIFHEQLAVVAKPSRVTKIMLQNDQVPIAAVPAGQQNATVRCG